MSWGTGVAKNTGNYTIDVWQVEDGLPQISVTSIAQTPDGYLWVGTFNGLARFDGVRFTVFHVGNTPALGDRGITRLQVDEQGALWIITEAGRLVRMAAGQFTVIQKEGAANFVSGFGDPNSPGACLLLQDRKGGWHQIENDQVRPLDARFSADDPPRFLFQNEGVGWVARRGKIAQPLVVDFPVLNAEGNASNVVSLTVYTAAVSQAGGYWLGTTNGLYRLQQGKLSPRVVPLPQADLLHCLLEDGQGTLWAGRWSKGLFHLDAQGAWQQVRVGNGLVDNYVNCLFRDREGSLWVGTGQGGLHRIRPQVFQMYGTESGPKVIMSLTQDRQGRMWFGVNGGGLHTWADGKLERVTEPAALQKYLLTYSVLADRQGAIWIGLYGNVALQWNAEAVTPHTLAGDPPVLMTAHALLEDHRGALWLGCANGLLRHEAGRFKHYSTQEGLSCNTVVALAEDRSGTLYVGTDGGGLNCLRQDRFTHFTQRDGLAANHLTSLYLDKEETLWIGTVYGGLCRFRQGRFTTAGAKDGLPTDTIGNLLEDDRDNLWIGSNRGIIRVSRLALNEYLDGKRKSVAWQVFGPSDGLSTADCVGASQPACCKAQDGRLWFATVNGVAVVNPNQLPFNRLPPPVVIEEVVLDEQPVVSSQKSDSRNPKAGGAATGDEGLAADHAPRTADPSPIANRESQILLVPPRTHRIEFRFTGLSLVAPEKVRFRYRLEPFDEDWVQAGARRAAHYTAVPPGRYEFRVTACNNDGVWNDLGTSLRLQVLPPWWKTWWFRALVVFGMCGAALGWHESRQRRLRRARAAQEAFARQLIASQESERQRIAGELHDGLGQDLLVIANQAQFGLGQSENPPATVVRLNDISATAKQALQQVRRISHNLRPSLLDELGFTKATAAMLEKAGHSGGLRVTVQLDDVDGLLPAEFEINLFRIIQESLNNIIKHAGASEAKVTLTRTPARLRLEIVDNGRGFDPAQSGAPDRGGLGLRQMAERARILGGRLHLHAQPGQGTQLTVDVPLQRSGTRSEPRRSESRL